jgi:hypothetical protein
MTPPAKNFIVELQPVPYAPHPQHLYTQSSECDPQESAIERSSRQEGTERRREKEKEKGIKGKGGREGEEHTSTKDGIVH